jgi:ATP-binding cassette, subfamily D (ALD), peroxisomal long-chain fatty acid import protein
MAVEREIQDLRERLSQVEEWNSRREQIEGELAKVWVESGEALKPPSYAEATTNPVVEEKRPIEPPVKS